MTQLIKELLDHQQWADAEHWRAFENFTEAFNDSKITDRLIHIHMAQRAFINTVEGEVFKPIEVKIFSPAKIKNYVRDTNQIINEFSEQMTDEGLNEKVYIPWFKNPVLDISKARALLQMTAHSHYHRAQNATRLRELGGEPPLIDLIFWYWKGQPDADWGID